MAPKRKNSLKPISNEHMSKSQSLENNKDSEHITENADIMDYLNTAEHEELFDNIAANTEIDILKEQINNLKTQNDELLKEIKILKDNQQVTINKNTNQEVIDKLVYENDTLILKNSELEFEISRLTQTLKLIQDKKDKELHSYTPSGYTQKTPPIFKKTFRQSKNGYQDWV